MSEPTRNESHVTEAVALLTSMFAGRKVVGNLLSAFVKQVQTLESHIWDVINSRTIDNGSGIVLDHIGRLVGQSRGGLTDAEFREAIRLRVLINRSTGKVVDVLRIIHTAAKGAPWVYQELPPAGFSVLIGAVTYARLRALAGAIKESKLKGTSATVLYTSGPLTSLFRPSSTTGTTVAARGPSHVATGLPAYPVAHVQKA